ncbi:MAG: glycosyl hydrolase, partial [Desulfobacterales bacterium]|nr:glycosyl hydrolase [Desulfobacterales bacterium]
MLRPVSLGLTLWLMVVIYCTAVGDTLEQRFQAPPDSYKPMPFWHINGELTTEGIGRQMKDAKELAGFSGVTVLPLTTGGRKPGTQPDFLSQAYFDRFQDILDTAKELDMQVILYDDIGFPSGMAGGKMEALYPEHTRKRLDKIEKQVKGRMRYRDILPGGTLMAAVAMNTQTLERVDLRPFIKDKRLEWQAPTGTWKVMYFVMVQEGTHKNHLMTDYLDPTAVEHLLSLTYDEYARRFSDSFGKTVQMVFFDDIGFWKYPRTWTGAFNVKFKELNGFDPWLFYPALWYDIGPDTAAIRNAFFKTRAELLAEGFPRLVGEWAKKHGLKDTGHPPGNYDPTPIDMNG